MSEWIIKCNREKCDTWERIQLGSNRTDGWISVWINSDTEQGNSLMHFCTPWCLNVWSMKFNFETEIIRWETDGGFIPPEVW